MDFEGKSLVCREREPGIAEIRFDLQGESVNKFDQQTLAELEQVVAGLQTERGLRGLLITSGKRVFIVGADITEFLPAFRLPEPELAAWLQKSQRIFSRLEDLPFPSVAAINGYCLGGGLELAMAATYRVISTEATVGQPEVKLGLIPGFGGTVRLPRLVGVDTALDLIASGREVRAAEALRLHLVSAAVAPEALEEAALALLRRAAGDDRWRRAVAVKKEPVLLNGVERLMAFNVAKGLVAQQAGPHYPAPRAAVRLLEKSVVDGRDAALDKEAEAFVKLARTPEAESLVGIFLADQVVKKTAGAHAKGAEPVAAAAVVGAGIMGGGIAYQAASRGVPVVMKDIRPEALEQGFGEASRLLTRQLERGRITAGELARTLAAIQGTLSYGDFARADVVVEAVVENPKVKGQVLAEVEAQVGEGAVLATNTSTISIDRLAEGLRRPERFCGMHFFNPVYRMPLVEVIRGRRTDPAALARVVAFAQQLGKTPIVVNDGPGFLVNRILLPYMMAFQALVRDGADIEAVDRTMEGFGWPMGPAWLSDVVGLDTARHAGEVMAAAFPERFAFAGPAPTDVLFQAGLLGQKSGRGFYRYGADGRDGKTFDPDVYETLRPAIRAERTDYDEATIVDRMMLPMVMEASRCLTESIVASPVELDMALILGLGFPPFRGGLLRWADREGAAALCRRADALADLGAFYQPTEQLRELARTGKGFHQG